MKPLDEEQLAAVEAAIDNAIDFESAISFDKADQIKKDIWSRLRLKPKYADGELVYSRKGLPTGPHYFPWCNNMSPADNLAIRPLTLTELGPEVKALRAAAQNACEGGPYYGQLKQALKAFDAKHGGE